MQKSHLKADRKQINETSDFRCYQNKLENQHFRMDIGAMHIFIF